MNGRRLPALPTGRQAGGRQGRQAAGRGRPQGEKHRKQKSKSVNIKGDTLTCPPLAPPLGDGRRVCRLYNWFYK
ncbi:hypothetical protein A3E04_01255 [Candidatus Kuenenbacteria bacterium RIFCSPHIGHO2_12_FULL_42_14]|uniref:Uncharacterized protein n=1 Tax=Candidatus Kuenenbacteria bacterium RIFCSPHIGHO2_12_FULL_42_14 TaxID=1798563 RepID=A0A1F6GKA7_9BACT|nr:MAG: hypothetical protein A3E04_01255 [Candidatus Kuenenbacteria bacterium RIFCSPHIGHO2_12_FULL_42_14]